MGYQTHGTAARVRRPMTRRPVNLLRGRSTPPEQLGALPVAAVLTVASSLFGHHNAYPNGNPANLATMDKVAQAGDLLTLRTIANGGTTPGGRPLGSGWPTNPGENIPWGENTPGRIAERTYARDLLTRIAAVTAAPVPYSYATTPPPSVIPSVPTGGGGPTSGQDLIAQIQAALPAFGPATPREPATVPGQPEPTVQEAGFLTKYQTPLLIGAGLVAVFAVMRATGHRRL
jgi:hypothetical protein